MDLEQRLKELYNALITAYHLYDYDLAEETDEYEEYLDDPNSLRFLDDDLSYWISHIGNLIDVL